MPRSRSARPLTIGAVLTQLREEFPEVSISKIRFLEDEGLVEPRRSPSGYRHYDPADVERLRYVLRSQRDHYWPLRVIKESLDAIDRGLAPAPGTGPRPQVPTPTVDPDLPAAEPARGKRLRLTRADLAAAAEDDPALVDALEAAGLVAADPNGHFDENDLRALHAVLGLARFGIEPRHLRPFRTVADREAGLVQQAVSGRPPRSATSDRAEVVRLCLQLHAALLKGALEP